MSVSQCFMGVSLTTNHITCNSLADGNITADIVNGTSPYTYTWSGGETTSSISSLAAGTYDITVTDDNGCVAYNSATVTEPAVITIDGNVTDESASGNDGAIDINVYGGVGPFTYSWSNASTNEDLTGLVAADYTVTVMDSHSCSNTATFTVNPFVCNLTSNITSTNVSCNGGSDGEATITVGNGTSPITYLWSDGQTMQTATGLTTGNYSITATDASSCTVTDAVTISEPTALAISNVVTDETVAGNDGAIDLTVTGGITPYTFDWSNLATSEDLTGIIAGTYDVTVTDFNGCTSTESITVNGVPCTLTATYTGTDASCNGLNDGQADVVASNGTTPYTYLWSDGQTTDIATGLTAGTYSVTVTDANSCTVTDSVTISEPTALAITYVVTDETVAGNDGAIDLTVTGGITPYTYDWSNSVTIEDLTGLTAGTYDVTVTDFNGCTSTSTIVVNGVTPCTLSAIASGTDVNCNAGNDGQAFVIASSGTTPYTYLWSDGQTTDVASGLTAGTYSVTVTDASSCTVTDAVTISEPTALTISYVVTDETVAGNDGAIDITISGGSTPFAFNWSNGATTEDISGLSANVYSVTVVDDNICTATQSIVVNIIGGTTTDTIGYPIPGTLTCSYANGNNTYGDLVKANYFDASSSAGYTDIDGVLIDFCFATNTTTTGTATVAIWDNSGTGGEPGSAPIATATINVSDVITDITNSQSTYVQFSSPVTIPGAFYAGVILPTTAGDSLIITSNSDGDTNPGTAWELWSDGTSWYDIASSWGVNEALAVYPILSTTPCTMWVYANSTDISCNAANDGTASVDVYNGTSPYTYNWSNGGTTSSLSSLSAGTYDVTVTDDNGCTDSGSATVSEPSAISLSFVVTDETVAGNDGAVDLTVTGGTPVFSFIWSNGETTEDISGLIAGTYDVTATDANGCSAIGSAVVNTSGTVITVDTLNYPIPGTPSCTEINGNNSYGDLAKANYFDAASYTGFTKIEGLLIDFCFATGSGNGEVAIWDNSGTSGNPGNSPIVSATIDISTVLTDIGNGQSTYVQFAQPIVIPGPFYAGVILPTVAGDTLFILSNSNGDTNPGIAWEQWSDANWYTVAGSWGVNEALAVYPVVNDEPVYSLQLTDSKDVIVVYPNPVNAILNIKSNNNINQAVLTNMLGEVVINNDANSNFVQIETSHLPKGIYLLQVKTDNGIRGYKVQIAR